MGDVVAWMSWEVKLRGAYQEEGTVGARLGGKRIWGFIWGIRSNSKSAKGLMQDKAEQAVSRALEQWKYQEKECVTLS